MVAKVWDRAEVVEAAQGGIAAEVKALRKCPSAFPTLVGYHAGEPLALVYRRYNQGSLDAALG